MRRERRWCSGGRAAHDATSPAHRLRTTRAWATPGWWRRTAPRPAATPQGVERTAACRRLCAAAAFMWGWGRGRGRMGRPHTIARGAARAAAPRHGPRRHGHQRRGSGDSQRAGTPSAWAGGRCGDRPHSRGLDRSASGGRSFRGRRCGRCGGGCRPVGAWSGSGALWHGPRSTRGHGRCRRRGARRRVRLRLRR